MQGRVLYEEFWMLYWAFGSPEDLGPIHEILLFIESESKNANSKEFICDCYAVGLRIFRW